MCSISSVCFWCSSTVARCRSVSCVRICCGIRGPVGFGSLVPPPFDGPDDSWVPLPVPPTVVLCLLCPNRFANPALVVAYACSSSSAVVSARNPASVPSSSSSPESAPPPPRRLELF
uniref:Putative secreted peptide n=1 Tax=Anopheles braziliensis TaxID=58242 RepID=A0A2M3ZUC0_9DIPT